MNHYEDINTTSSPLNIHPGGRYSVSSNSSSKPALFQSSTQITKPRLAQANIFSRAFNAAARVKRSKQSKKKAKKQKKKATKAAKSTKAKSIKARATAPTAAPHYATYPPSNPRKTSPSSIAQSKSQHNNTTNVSAKSPKKHSANIESKETDQKHINYDKLVIFLHSKGYMIQTKIADTLQGAIYRCKLVDKSQRFAHDTVVIKVTRKDLHYESMTILENGTKKQIQENIVKESDILRDLTLTNDARTKYMTRYIDFFEDDTLLFLVMEDGGSDLFEYVVRCHQLIRKGQLNRKEWRLMCKKLFKQMIEFLDYLHTQHNICHIDISLENMLIENGTIFQNVKDGKITLNRDVTIKFCDFGLSEKFDPREDFKCTKYVGKTRYKSPELWTKSMVFDARLNDVWSMGITLFMMIIGVPPLKYPDNNDEHFQLIISGHILELIQSWNRAKYMTPQILELLLRMLKKEKDRITLDEITKHSWVKLK